MDWDSFVVMAGLARSIHAASSIRGGEGIWNRRLKSIPVSARENPVAERDGVKEV